MAPSDALHVDAELLRQLGIDLAAHADGLAGVDPSPAFAPVHGALAGSDTARICAEAAPHIHTALVAVADRIRQMAQAATSNATAYEASERQFVARLRALAAGS